MEPLQLYHDCMTFPPSLSIIWLYAQHCYVTYEHNQTKLSNAKAGPYKMWGVSKYDTPAYL